MEVISGAQAGCSIRSLCYAKIKWQLRSVDFNYTDGLKDITFIHQSMVLKVCGLAYFRQQTGTSVAYCIDLGLILNMKKRKSVGFKVYFIINVCERQL